MIQTLNKHVKWRRDKKAIFVCDCKRLIDLKISFKYESFMKKLNKGIKKEKLNKEEKKVFSDFEKINLLSKLKIRSLKEKDFENALNILDNELGKERVRNAIFLHNKFKEFPQFFIGIFLDKDLTGIICGFPREDYLLMSEIAVDLRFHGRGFGERLVKAFEKISKKDYNKINAGAHDKAIGFYKSLGYKPFLLIQFKKEDYSLEDFIGFQIVNYNPGIIEAKVKNCNIKIIEKLRKKYPKAYFQYIFIKKL